MRIEETKVYTCPDCDSENIIENTSDAEVGDSVKWNCDDCGNCEFLPNGEDVLFVETEQEKGN